MKRSSNLFLSIAFLLGTCVCAAQNTVAPASDSVPVPIMRTPVYLQNPAEDGMTVMWITNPPCRSWVEYGTDSLDMKIAAKTSPTTPLYMRV